MISDSSSDMSKNFLQEVFTQNRNFSKHSLRRWNTPPKECGKEMKVEKDSPARGFLLTFSVNPFQKTHI